MLAANKEGNITFRNPGGKLFKGLSYLCRVFFSQVHSNGSMEMET